ncbi:uncharacterized protein FOMMEDRAFT_27108 [Fomitiporia mediterranea MF3/22]|uniref:uncharacterized protein n=1 Tax=Fomitiporia mediterranea (strain MF3/22) TaxID=694068 RepID=UPI0004409B0A|nr:uncharacterized protein FOMMEDRAFT_27108 [Fomitiporia mediterranea MF3/22]EJD04796.1 hypothetical protein FOMMEDRAFT_27108 [Fomitiporia mediterranea MF3/22]
MCRVAISNLRSSNESSYTQALCSFDKLGIQTVGAWTQSNPDSPKAHPGWCMPLNDASGAFKLKHKGDEPLCKGNFSTVWRVERSDFPDNVEKDFAAKITLKRREFGTKIVINNKKPGNETRRKDNTDALVEDFTRREARLLSELRHRNVILWVIVLEVAEGGELYDRLLNCINTLQFTEKAAAHYMRQYTFFELVAAIASFTQKEFSTETSIMNRPQNLFIKRTYQTSTPFTNDELLLGDFGFAIRIDNLEKKAPTGTPLYMAPEVFCLQQYSYGMDIWGIVIP